MTGVQDLSRITLTARSTTLDAISTRVPRPGRMAPTIFPCTHSNLRTTCQPHREALVFKTAWLARASRAGGSNQPHAACSLFQHLSGQEASTHSRSDKCIVAFVASERLAEVPRHGLVSFGMRAVLGRCAHDRANPEAGPVQRTPLHVTGLRKNEHRAQGLFRLLRLCDKLAVGSATHALSWLRGLTYQHPHTPQITEALVSLQPHIITLNEVDTNLRPEALETVAHALTKETGDPWNYEFFGHVRGRYGNAVLSRYPISARQDVNLRGGTEVKLTPGRVKPNGEVGSLTATLLLCSFDVSVCGCSVMWVRVGSVIAPTTGAWGVLVRSC